MDLRLHVLLDPAVVPVADLPRFCREIRQGGATLIQLRGKHTAIPELLAYGRILRDETATHQLGLIVNDRVDVALALGADGVHIGQDDMPVADARRIAPNLVIGNSVGSPKELEEAIRHRPDYLGMGPVFATVSKPDAGPALGLPGFVPLLQAAQQNGLPVVAIGGISSENAASVWAAGANGIAVISAVVGVRSWQEACRGLLAAAGPR